MATTTTPKNPNLGLEVPAFGAAAAAQAVALGATRIELNALSSYSDGGTTPSLADLEELCTSTTAAISTPTPSANTTSTASLRTCRSSKIPLRIMIRPRGPPEASSRIRDFIYNDEEYDAMLWSIQVFKTSRLLDVERGDGFVFGILEEEEEEGAENRQRKCWVDSERCARLVRAAQPYRSIFHRAFDEIVSCDGSTLPRLAETGEVKAAVAATPSQPSWETALEALATCGFSGILTSGGLGRAIDNVANLEKIIQKAEDLGVIENGNGMEIIVGGGVRTANVAELVQRLGLRDRKPGSVYLHSACLATADGSERIDASELKGILEQVV